MGLASVAQSDDFGPKNVYGEPLQSCSSSGMALTGFTRTGLCVNQQDDIGSHHICIDLSSTTGGNFCTVTGQPNWCSSNMPCHDSKDNLCPIEHWCVCQWAFAKYIQMAGGCEHIQKIECNAVNKHALHAYQNAAQSDKQYMDALKCIESKCGLSEE